MTVELHDIPEPAAAQFEKLTRGMQIRMACSTISSVSKDIGVDASAVLEWLGQLSGSADYFDYHRAVAREATPTAPELEG